MEKSKDVTMICSEFGWSDVGTWGSLFTLKDNEENKNVSNGSHLYDCHDCIIRNSNNKYVVVEGLNDYIVAGTDDVLLICPLKNEQKIRDFVSDAKKNNDLIA